MIECHNCGSPIEPHESRVFTRGFPYCDSTCAELHRRAEEARLLTRAGDRSVTLLSRFYYGYPTGLPEGQLPTEYPKRDIISA